jgi:hypothetical protein
MQGIKYIEKVLQSVFSSFTIVQCQKRQCQKAVPLNTTVFARQNYQADTEYNKLFV